MKLNTGLTSLFIGVGLSILTISHYLQHPTDYIYLLMTFFFFSGIITGLFELKNYHNKNFYLMVGAILIIIMWITILIQPFYVHANEIFIYGITGLITLFIISVFLLTIREWDKSQKSFNS